MEIEQRVDELEIALSHNEKTISDLSDIIYKQQKQIDILLKKHELLKDKLDEALHNPQLAPQDEPPPPHY